jgi:hypothetical protein
MSSILKAMRYCRTDAVVGSIFYFGYLAGQLPAGYLLQRLPMAKFLGVCTLGELNLNLSLVSGLYFTPSIHLVPST